MLNFSLSESRDMSVLFTAESPVPSIDLMDLVITLFYQRLWKKVSGMGISNRKQGNSYLKEKQKSYQEWKLITKPYTAWL